MTVSNAPKCVDWKACDARRHANAMPDDVSPNSKQAIVQGHRRNRVYYLRRSALSDSNQKFLKNVYEWEPEKKSATKFKVSESIALARAFGGKAIGV